VLDPYILSAAGELSKRVEGKARLACGPGPAESISHACSFFLPSLANATKSSENSHRGQRSTISRHTSSRFLKSLPAPHTTPQADDPVPRANPGGRRWRGILLARMTAGEKRVGLGRFQVAESSGAEWTYLNEKT
jgi:hypothetical protein